MPVKYAHRRVTFMALLKRILKMAQLEPLYSRRGMLAGSFSMVVGVAVGGGDDTVDIMVALGDEGVDRAGQRNRRTRTLGAGIDGVGQGP